MSSQLPSFVVLTSNSYFSYLILSEFLSVHRNRVRAVIETRGFMKGRSLLGTLWTVLRRSGLRGSVYKLGTAGFSRMLDVVARWKPGSQRAFGPLSLARRLGITVAAVTDANGEDCLVLLRTLKPDLVCAVNVYQLIRPPLLAIPRLGVINLHFGMLPDYRGMSPYIWALSRGEKEIGLTAHFMDERFDTGDIVEQRAVQIRPGESAFEVYVRSCLAARSMLCLIARLAGRGPLPRRPQPIGTGTYFALPDRACLRELRRKRHPLLRLRDLMAVVTGSYELPFEGEG
jgi:hypothetical protein